MQICMFLCVLMNAPAWCTCVFLSSCCLQIDLYLTFIVNIILVYRIIIIIQLNVIKLGPDVGGPIGHPQALDLVRVDPNAPPSVQRNPPGPTGGNQSAGPPYQGGGGAGRGGGGGYGGGMGRQNPSQQGYRPGRLWVLEIDSREACVCTRNCVYVRLPCPRESTKCSRCCWHEWTTKILCKVSTHSSLTSGTVCELALPVPSAAPPARPGFDSYSSQRTVFPITSLSPYQNK